MYQVRHQLHPMPAQWQVPPMPVSTGSIATRVLPLRQLHRIAIQHHHISVPRLPPVVPVMHRQPKPMYLVYWGQVPLPGWDMRDCVPVGVVYRQHK